MERIDKSERQWRTELSPERFAVLRIGVTEPPFADDLDDLPGSYHCAGCDEELFTSEARYDSGSGWPSFFASAADHVLDEDLDTRERIARTEVSCARCGGHIGHVFPDGPAPTGLRFCVNSAALVFEER